ncbi:YcaO-like family protein [Stappia indica]|uniref:YcaO-like family protein n=1 Tax=Stappia indica TaxID=538381 RepID=UPI001CD76859|nr:YcaO-like family protein [Stappia indica]MCA1298432.1 YcaO-like family protein [Stappia indica]
MREETREALRAAADLVAGLPLPEAVAGAAWRLLRGVGAGEAEVRDADRDFAALLRAAARLDRLFELPVPDAPGLGCFGAQVSSAAFGALHDARTSVSGVGSDRLSAFRACVAEAVEFVSQFETEGETRAQPADETLTSTEEECAPLWPLLGTAELRAGDDIAALRLADGVWVRLPAALCWRRSQGRFANGLSFAMGLGVAAGRNGWEADCRAILEWIERDAVALWWRGGRRGRAVSLEELLSGETGARLTRYRADARDRRTWFLDLTGEIGVPVAAALSVDSQGRGFCYGFAARACPDAARLAALEELMQIELADRVVAAKRLESGEEALNDMDRRHLRRSTGVAGDWPILHPAGPALPPAAPLPEEPEALLPDLVERLAGQGFAVHRVDLTRQDIGIYVSRMLITGLQPDPSDVVLERLATQRRSSGDDTAAERVGLY